MSEAVPSVVAIDIGTHKVSVLIAKVHAPDNIQVIGMATARNRGMSKGKIVNIAMRWIAFLGVIGIGKIFSMKRSF